MSKLERDDQLLEKADLKLRPEQLPDEVIDIDFDCSHLGKYFTSQGWQHLLQTGENFCNTCSWEARSEVPLFQFN